MKAGRVGGVREQWPENWGAGEGRWEADDFGHKGVVVNVIGVCPHNQQRIGEHLGGVWQHLSKISKVRQNMDLSARSVGRERV